MNCFDTLQRDYKLHRNARTTKHTSYPGRFIVPDDKVKWEIPFLEYNPEEFNAPVILDPQTSWADPQDIKQVTHTFESFEGKVAFNSHGFPLNPFGRTGMAGRGVLGKWGANFAVDGLITTLHPETHCFLVLTIVRKDTGETAIPGGMIDTGETSLQARNRELEEELSLSSSDLKDPIYEKIVTKGYVDDPRNTDHAWMETTVYHVHFTYERAMLLSPSAGDDAQECRWKEVNSETIMNFYANHGLSVLLAIKTLFNQPLPFMDKQAHSFINKFAGI